MMRNALGGPTQLPTSRALLHAPSTLQPSVSEHLQASSMMSHFYSLPPEIIFAIADFLKDDAESIKALRLVDRDCSLVCTRLLFRSIRFVIDKESMAHFHCILGNPDIRHAVTTIRVNTAEYTDRNMETFDWDDRDEELLKLFNHYLSRFGRFSNLRAVHLKFSKACVGPPLRRHWWASQVPESVTFRMDVLQSLMKGLNDTENPTQLFKSLTIENLQDWTDDSLVKSSDFEAVLTKVRRLDLQIATEEDETLPTSFMEKKELHDFFNQQLCRGWLNPCITSLKHLKLYAGSVYWGYIPKCALPHFPNLESISLGRMTFSHDSQLDWILSHATTLTELTLDDCPIVIGTAWSGVLDDDGYPVDTTRVITSDALSTRLYASRWHTYFRAFREKLTQLLIMRCGFDDRDWEDAVAFSRSHTLGPRLWPQRYRVFDTCWLERPPFRPQGGAERAGYDGAWTDVPFYPDCTDEDLIELVKLRDGICDRTGVEDEELALLKMMIC